MHLSLHTAAGGLLGGLWQPVSWPGIGLAVTALAYATAFLIARRAARRREGRPPPRRHALAFAAGWAGLAVALVGPLDAWSDDAFSAHMLQHLVLLQAAVPLVLLGRPAQLGLRAMPKRWSGALLRATLGHAAPRRVIAAVGHPVTVTVLFAAGMLAWHWPPLYHAALEQPLVHAAEHLTFVGAALAFWGILVDPLPRSLKVAATTAVGMCLVAALAGDGLGLALGLAPRVVYPYYVARDNPWDLDPLTDQHLGGALMWAGGLVYFGVAGAILVRAARAGGAR